MSERIPILLDTDIGSDIDDAVALAYLLRQPRCELVGITTVSGIVAQRAACAQAICARADRADIPIHTGISDVLLLGKGQPNVPQYAAIKDNPHRLDWPKNSAIPFLPETIRSRPGEITLLSIGPLANIATLFALDPEIPSLLKGFVSMAGAFFPKGSPTAHTPPEVRPSDNREWNIFVDPIAAAMTYRARPPFHLSVGLDVTLPCTMPAAPVREKFASRPPLDVVLSLAEVWFSHVKQIVFHDPLAATLIFNPAICGTTAGTIEIPLDPNPETCGKTLFTPSPDGPHQVCTTVNTQAFFDEYFSVFK